MLWLSIEIWNKSSPKHIFFASLLFTHRRKNSLNVEHYWKWVNNLTIDMNSSKTYTRGRGTAGISRAFLVIVITAVVCFIISNDVVILWYLMTILIITFNQIGHVPTKSIQIILLCHSLSLKRNFTSQKCFLFECQSTTEKDPQESWWQWRI